MSQRRKPTPKPVPIGAALDTPDEELDMAALITPEDIATAKADGRARMGKRGAAMLETVKTPKDEDEPTG